MDMNNFMFSSFSPAKMIRKKISKMPNLKKRSKTMLELEKINKLQTFLSVKSLKPIKNAINIAKKVPIPRRASSNQPVLTRSELKNKDYFISSTFLEDQNERGTANFNKRKKYELCSLSRKGLTEGKPRELNKDAYIVFKNITAKNQIFAGIFDAFGPEGHQVSHYFKQKFEESFRSSLKISKTFSHKTSFNFIIRDVVKNLEMSMRLIQVNLSVSGCTFLSVFINGNELFVTGLGDLKALLGSYDKLWNWRTVNRVHNLEDSLEKFRIEVSKGNIYREKNKSGQEVGPLKIQGLSDKSAGVCFTRSIGGYEYRDVGVTNECETLRFDLKHEDKFLIIGSDGLWSGITDLQAVQIVSKNYECGSINSACVNLQNIAFRNTSKKEQEVDDITVIIIFFN